MKAMYGRIQEKMLLDLKNAREEIQHQGEKGREVERILSSFLRWNLPRRYSVSTGIVVSSNGAQSAQTDIIVHDREFAPAIFEREDFSLVPIETVYGVISVKTSVNRQELRNAIHQVASVRNLHQLAVRGGGGRPLRPRGFLFAFDTEWRTTDTVLTALREELTDIHDTLRPNALCILPMGLFRRRPFELNFHVEVEHCLLQFFMALVMGLDTFPEKRVDLGPYFANYDGPE